VCGDFTNSPECFIQGTLFGKGCSWNGTECVAGGNGNGTSCTSLGSGCLLDGIRRCDLAVPTDLCECDASTGRYVLLQHNCPDCIPSPPNDYKACFTNANGVKQCAPTVGHENDICYATGLDFGCPCTAGQCDLLSWCASDSRCMKRSIGDAMNLTETMVTCTKNGDGYECIYDLNSNVYDPSYPFPFAASNLQNATIHYKWGPLPASGGGGWIKAYYDGAWHTLWQNDAIFFTWDNGDVTIGNISFPSTGIEKLSIRLWCVGTSIQPTTFSGQWFF